MAARSRQDRESTVSYLIKDGDTESMHGFSRERFESGLTYEAYRKTVTKHERLWNGVYDHLRVPADALNRIADLPGNRNVAVLAEDWCGDAASLVPVLAKVAAAAPELVDLRVFSRDENLDVMDQHLSHGGRSIPVAIVFDDAMKKVGWWGPRPGPAQALFREKLRDYKAGRLTDKREEVNKPVLKWYRLDRGRHTIDEFLTILERGGSLRA
jgi:hypothetical protein